LALFKENAGLNGRPFDKQFGSRSVPAERQPRPIGLTFKKEGREEKERENGLCVVLASGRALAWIGNYADIPEPCAGYVMRRGF
jgi:hypothetical protein